MAKLNKKLLFLKSTGVMIGEITEETDMSVLDLSQFFIKTVEIDTDLDQYWMGDYHTGKLQSRTVKPVVTESELKYNTNLKVLSEYSIHKQLNIIVDMLNKSDLEKTPEFVEMKAFLDRERAIHAEKVAVYANNPEAYVFVTQAQESAEIAKKVL